MKTLQKYFLISLLALSFTPNTKTNPIDDVTAIVCGGGALLGAYMGLSALYYGYYRLYLPFKIDAEMNKYNVRQGQITPYDVDELARNHHATLSESNTYYGYCYLAYESKLTSIINQLYISQLFISGDARAKKWHLIEMLKGIRYTLNASPEFVRQQYIFEQSKRTQAA